MSLGKPLLEHRQLVVLLARNVRLCLHVDAVEIPLDTRPFRPGRDLDARRRCYERRFDPFEVEHEPGVPPDLVEAVSDRPREAGLVVLGDRSVEGNAPVLDAPSAELCIEGRADSPVTLVWEQPELYERRAGWRVPAGKCQTPSPARASSAAPRNSTRGAELQNDISDAPACRPRFCVFPRPILKLSGRRAN
jgi:hypothetical protein